MTTKKNYNSSKVFHIGGGDFWTNIYKADNLNNLPLNFQNFFQLPLPHPSNILLKYRHTKDKNGYNAEIILNVDFYGWVWISDSGTQ